MMQKMPKSMTEAIAAPITVTLKTKAEVGIALVALISLLETVKDNNDTHAMRAAVSVIRQIMPGAKEAGFDFAVVGPGGPDWDCGDPDCLACGEARAQRSSHQHQDAGVLDGPIPLGPFVMKRGDA
jgi:hypothetical protein